MSPETQMYLAQGIHGLAYGMLLFLVASGLTLIFGMMGILNIAHASFFMLAAYLCVTVLQATGSFWIALLLAPLAVALLGILVERFCLRRAQASGLGHIADLLLTLGISLVLAEAVKLIWGSEGLQVMAPYPLAGLVSVGGLEYPVYRLFIIVLSLAVLGMLSLVLYRTRLGTIVRAAVTDPDMVSVLGVNTSRVFMLVFGLGTWMAGVAGVAAAPILTVYPGLADQMGMDAFVVVVVGGFGSLFGALVAALFLGELNAFGIQFIPKLSPVLMFGFMALVLAFKPTGLFGDRE
ncbi:MAG: branched-chain amino acid ABC transporter permease [Deltaproteobacteria bacterium]|nr:branched-chain amino acid ABC transporter permease [Deltaproteobacteria bacterium]